MAYQVPVVIFFHSLIDIFTHSFIRQQRIAEIKKRSEKARFGDVREISAVDYVQVKYSYFLKIYYGFYNQL